MILLLANVGSPLIHATACFLLFLNALIGVIEGYAISRFCGVAPRRAIPIMIVANYVSGWTGTFLLPWLVTVLREQFFAGPPLFSAGAILGIMLVVAFIGSIIIETPFAMWAGWTAQKGVRRTIGVFVVAQIVTFVIVTALFASVSDFSMLRFRIERGTGAVAPQGGGWVYFINPDRTIVSRVRLDGTRVEEVLALPIEQPRRVSALYVMRGENESWDLWAERIDSPLLRNFAKTAGAFVDDGDVGPGPPTSRAADLRDDDDRPWIVVAYSFGWPTIRFELPPTADSRGPIKEILGFIYALETWSPRSPTVLPGGFVVLEWGPSQIVIIDYEKRRIGYLAEGRGPVVVLDEEF